MDQQRRLAEVTRTRQKARAEAREAEAQHAEEHRKSVAVADRRMRERAATHVDREQREDWELWAWRREMLKTCQANGEKLDEVIRLLRAQASSSEP